MGRCPVRIVFPEALALLAKKQDKLRYYDPVAFYDPRWQFKANFFSFMFEKIMPLSQAVEGYDMFSKMAAQKIIFVP